MSICVDRYPYACPSCNRPTVGWMLESLKIVAPGNTVLQDVACPFCHRASLVPLPPDAPSESRLIPGVNRRRLPDISRQRLALADRADAINDVRATALSSLVTSDVLFEKSADELAEVLASRTKDRCAHCTLCTGYETVDGVGTCNHCGWPTPKYSRRRGRSRPSRIATNVQSMIDDFDAAMRRHEI